MVIAIVPGTFGMVLNGFEKRLSELDIRKNRDHPDYTFLRSIRMMKCVPKTGRDLLSYRL